MKKMLIVIGIIIGSMIYTVNAKGAERNVTDTNDTKISVVDENVREEMTADMLLDDGVSVTSKVVEQIEVDGNVIATYSSSYSHIVEYKFWDGYGNTVYAYVNFNYEY